MNNSIEKYVKENRRKFLNYIAEITEDIMEDEDELESLTDKYFDNTTFEFDEGASKKVIIFDKLGFVLKWDNQGDSCREVTLYEEAVQKSLADFFPYTAVICEHLGYDWIIQEIAKPFFTYYRKDIREMQKTIKTHQQGLDILYNMFCDIPNCTRTDCLSADWLKIAAGFFGLTLTGKLARFVQENRINDLHSGNVGFIGKRPVLIDFCGYHWDEDYYKYS